MAPVITDTVRVLIVDMPAMLREIVRQTVESEDGMVVAGEVAGDAVVQDAIDRTQAHVVILDAQHPVLGDHGPARLAATTEAVRLLAVAADGRDSFLYALKPIPIALGELSPERLAAAIRSDATSRTGRERS